MRSDDDGEHQHQQREFRRVHSTGYGGAFAHILRTVGSLMPVLILEVYPNDAKKAMKLTRLSSLFVTAALETSWALKEKSRREDCEQRWVGRS